MHQLKHSRFFRGVPTRHLRDPSHILEPQDLHTDQPALPGAFTTLSNDPPPPPPPQPTVEVPRSGPSHLDDLYEYYDPERKPSPQRQQHISTPVSQRPPLSSPSSGIRSLRRTPRLQERRIEQAEGVGYSPTPRPDARLATQLSGFDVSESTSPQDFQRLVEDESYWPRRSTRVSRHTHNAILFALEAIRKGSGVNAKPLTPDLLEEQARMSDLVRGNAPGATARVQNGGAPRTAAAAGTGPTATEPPRYRTPTDVMRERRLREARRAEEAAARNIQEEQRRIQQGGQVVGVGEDQTPRPTARTSTGRTQPTQTFHIRGQSAQMPAGSDRRQESIVPAQAGPSRAGLVPSQSGGTDPRLSASTQRNRTEAYEQLNLPATSRPAVPEQTPRIAQQPQQPPSARPQPPLQPVLQAGPQQGPLPGPQPGPQPSTQTSGTAGRSRFPNAFERWEDLSAHWEGIVSSFIHRMQNNADELAGKPLEKQMARQIDDLSAAGANLFHAVVELQRLRASSERKFQRWFFETRQEQEQAQERQAELERQLRAEREARTVSSTSIEVVRADRNRAEELVKEMRRELQISKEEARRAWEELGRREQEERERTIALRSGEPTLIGGVQVVPMQGLSNRQISSAYRPQTREGPAGGAGPTILSGQQRSAAQRPRSQSQTTGTSLDSPGEETRQFTFQPETGGSPTVTDPFTESSRQREAIQTGPEPETQFYTTPPRPTMPQTSAAAIAASRAATSAAQELRYSQSPATNSQMSGALPAPTRRGTGGTEQSYIASTMSGASEDEYTRDPQGHSIPYRQPIGPSGLRAELSDDDGGEGDYSDEDDDDHTADIERERMYAAQYRPQQAQQQQVQIPRTTSGPLPAIPQGRMPEYEGEGYETEAPPIVTQAQTGWEELQATRHRHPTRLSDIIEETTQRTSPSRTSYVSGSGPLPGQSEGGSGPGNMASRR
ncbi:hypothetical protein PV08_06301 [Exophiala spinifera]|uniref:Uncharacterized protein n=1 Tax=Exophiala spinifera TaxID=91928 RepID=A0A0D2BC97_9EURO|nr:uncharacterized protein PV08_06301 [Exophiala spinifera]KIW16250.1 hypothetical protein PV08_06301 [Exophiala spinifera]